MPQRSGLKTGANQSFSCNQVIDDAVMNNLNDLAASAMERGDTVINQTGSRQPDRTYSVLCGYYDGDITLATLLPAGWNVENAGYNKYLIKIAFKLDSTAYSAGSGTGTDATRITITHTDKAGLTSTLWDTETASGIVRGVQTSATISGTFSNPPSSGETEIEQFGINVYSNHTSTAQNNASWSGVLNFFVKLYRNA